MRKSKDDRELVVAVMRESIDGQVYSAVRPWPRREMENGQVFVVDRQKGRGLDTNTVISRAKSLALLLDVRYVEDLRWHCVADQLRACRCPVCVGATPNPNGSGEPTPMKLDPISRQPIRPLRESER